jgi:predicted MPP superfamily phosphohydrolase
LALRGAENAPFKILMTHDPTHWTKKVISHPTRFDLTFSGHTHGMQMGVEIPGFKWSPVKYLYPQWAGLYQEAKQFLYVNRGFGFVGFPGRAGIWPEITVVELGRNVV